MLIKPQPNRSHRRARLFRPIPSPIGATPATGESSKCKPGAAEQRSTIGRPGTLEVHFQRAIARHWAKSKFVQQRRLGIANTCIDDFGLAPVRRASIARHRRSPTAKIGQRRHIGAQPRYLLPVPSPVPSRRSCARLLAKMSSPQIMSPARRPRDAGRHRSFEAATLGGALESRTGVRPL